MHRFQPFPTPHPNVPQRVRLDTLRYVQHHGQQLVYMQPGFLQQSYSSNDSDFVPIHRPQTIWARVASPRVMSSDNLGELQWAAENYEQKPEAPLVGGFESIELIRQQFADADNVVYRVKSEALARSFSHIRQIRPDGNCGWTALIYSYFETLLRSGNPAKFNDEIEKLKQVNTVLSRWYPEDTYVDWWDDTVNLLQATAVSLSTTGDPMTALVAAFNDGYTASALIQYFRMIVSAWIQDKANIYEPFILGETAANSVADYCRHHLEMHTVEIDGIGIYAFCDVVLNPAGLAVKIKYLDTSPGVEANTHSLGPLDSNDVPIENLPTIWLLYTIRGPGHYDIVYKPEAEPETTVMLASHTLFQNELRWAEAGQEQPRLQSSIFQHDGQSHGGMQLGDVAWTVPGSTLLGEPIPDVSGSAHFPPGSETYSEPLHQEPSNTVFADLAHLSIQRSNSQIESEPQNTGPIYITEGSQESRVDFAVILPPRAGCHVRDDPSSAFTGWPQVPLQTEGTLPDPSLLNTAEFRTSAAPNLINASIPFHSFPDEPPNIPNWNTRRCILTSEPSIPQHTPAPPKQFHFRIVNEAYENQAQLLLNPLASPFTSKKPLDLGSSANFMREDWEPIHSEFESNTAS